MEIITGNRGIYFVDKFLLLYKIYRNYLQQFQPYISYFRPLSVVQVALQIRQKLQIFLQYL